MRQRRRGAVESRIQWQFSQCPPLAVSKVRFEMVVGEREGSIDVSLEESVTVTAASPVI